MRRVFHGSNMVIERPLANIGRANLDFGVGFYVTSIQSQAEMWAGIKGRYFLQDVSFVSTYDFDFDAAVSHFSYRKFAHYDSEWLHFIVNNRRGGDVWKQFDIIEGGVANDRVIDTVENYMAGLIDEEFALKQLSKHQPNNQICIVNQEVIDKYLCFVDSFQVKADVE